MVRLAPNPKVKAKASFIQPLGKKECAPIIAEYKDLIEKMRKYILYDLRDGHILREKK